MNCLLHNRDLRHERVKVEKAADSKNKIVINT